MMGVVIGVSTKLNGFGSCGCDHWRDARTVWIIGWTALALVFALTVVVWRVRARRRAMAGVGGGSMVIRAKRCLGVDAERLWQRGALRLDDGSLSWWSDGDAHGVDLDPSTVRAGPAVGASQFPFTVSLVVRCGGDDVSFALRPGDDVVLMELCRRVVVTAQLASTGDQ